MQGITQFIPTDLKIRYINSLLNAGFDTIDFGSFVSPKAIPQMRDTAEVLAGLNIRENSAKLLAIVANQRGAEQAVQFDEINYLGFPFSISETFQLRNTNSTIAESLSTVEQIQQLCEKRQKSLVVYLSMGFGNPYGDPWNAEVVEKWSRKLSSFGIHILALSDTIGVSDPSTIATLFSALIPEFPGIEFGAHLHSTPETREEKIDAAYQSGCRRFDSAIKGYGGCPMAKDELTGNIATESVIDYFDKHQIPHTVQTDEFNEALLLSAEVFSYH